MLTHVYATPVADQVLYYNEKNQSTHDANLVSIKGKRVLTYSELKSSTPVNIRRLKQLVGGDTIGVRDAHQKRGEGLQQFKSFGKLWIACNEPLEITGRDESFEKSVVYVEFKCQFLPERDIEKEYQYADDPEFKGWLTSNEGREAFLKYILDNAPRDEVPIPEDVRSFTEEVKELVTAESSIQFIDSMLTEGGEIKASDLFNVYRSYCVKNRLKQVTATKFGMDMKSRYEGKRKKDGNYYLVSLLE